MMPPLPKAAATLDGHGMEKWGDGHILKSRLQLTFLFRKLMYRGGIFMIFNRLVYHISVNGYGYDQRVLFCDVLLFS